MTCLICDQPAHPPYLVCLTHHQRVRDLIDQTVWVHGWLTSQQAAHHPQVGERVTGSRTPTLIRDAVIAITGPTSQPSRSRWEAEGRSEEEIRDLLADNAGVTPNIPAILTGWVQVVVEETGDPITLTHPSTTTQGVGQLGRYLATHLHHVSQQAWVADMHQDLREVVGVAHRVAPWRPPRVRLDDPCDTCGVRGLVADLAEERVWCAACHQGRHLTDYELRWLLPSVREAG